MSNTRVPFAHTIYSSILNRQHSVFQASVEKVGGRNAAWRELQDAKLTSDEYAEVLTTMRNPVCVWDRVASEMQVKRQRGPRYLHFTAMRNPLDYAYGVA